MAECLRQIVPDRWASIRKRSFTKCFCLYTGVTKVRVSDGDRNKRRRKQEEDRQEGGDVKKKKKKRHSPRFCRGRKGVNSIPCI